MTTDSRAKSDEVYQIEGTGLGLPLAKALAEAHGGSLKIKSKLNVGTTASVIFPAERVIA
jgi:signal transduction histidine kinase